MDSISIVAIYAAIISTLGAAWILRQWQMSRPRIAIDTRFALIGVEPMLEVISITASNIGGRPITVREMGFEFPDGTSLVYWAGPMAIGGTNLPERIQPYEEVTVYFELSGLADKLNELKVFPNGSYARISNNKRFRSKLKKDTVRDWFFRNEINTQESKK